jgi:hypothetical protein
VRDPYGFRPLCIGRIGDAWVLASETCALDLIHAKFVRDVQPGEIVVINEQGLTSVQAFRSRSAGLFVFLNTSILRVRTARLPIAAFTSAALRWEKNLPGVSD